MIRKALKIVKVIAITVFSLILVVHRFDREYGRQIQGYLYASLYGSGLSEVRPHDVAF